MKLKILLMLAAAAAGLHGADAPAPYDIGEELATESFWKSDPVLFVKRHEAQGFNFTSGAREGADTRLDGAVTYKGIPVYETKVAFGELGGICLSRAISAYVGVGLAFWRLLAWIYEKPKGT